MDLGLPDINGYQATEEILSHRTNVSIIAQTAFTSIYVREKALKSGCIGYITKPINISKLLSVINKHALEIKK
jgi:CheY-like chemotaxis protein